ncbi:enoyl-CoA hydratase/isomerase family protein [Minwuia thermotolerans]|uniref:Enoyl-CoA hydratase n=1 Tax=Minwuia thermotolerans TaxID=2056226 RepID=A0A2M9G2S7_9PROT|nr:enoyl-CoA hydratase-related protein [Minwuia thermotolerans]PJK30027.1 enoyl-CoA hydratase [Minwuia thermotolerans]
MSTVLYEVRGRVAVITLNRPDKLNALSKELGAELAEAWTRFQAGPERAAVLTAAGDRAFSVGADLRDPPEIWPFAPSVGVHVDKPVVAAVNGICVGGAFILVQFCDLCVMAEDATFVYPEAKVGLSGGLIASVAARVPHKIAMEFMMLGEPMTAARAYETGMVNRVVPQAEVMDAAMDYAEKLAGLAPMVLSTLKRHVAEMLPKGPSERAGLARRDLEAIRSSSDFAEGAAAFREKRAPDFTGR